MRAFVQLYVHQSGKARLVIGGVSLVVHPGLPVSFVEQGVSIDSDKRTFCSFGQVRKREREREGKREGKRPGNQESKGCVCSEM